MNIIGIRKEDEHKKFERRVALTPAHIHQLLQAYPEAQFIVEPGHSGRYERAFTDDEYRAAGAQIGSMEAADVILGIKEVPIQDLLPGKTYLYFSHTYKGQPYNMPMLRKLLALDCTLLDYELIVDDVPEADYALDHCTRNVYFGHFAGYAGAINTLYALGQRLEYEGIRSPFAYVKQSIDYHAVPGAQFGDFDTAMTALKRVGERICNEGLPDELLPMIFGVTGGGNVASAVRNVLAHLPVIEVAPEDLLDFNPPIEEARHHVYVVQFRQQQRRLPEFKQYARHLTALFNGIKWKSHQPRLITRAFLKDLYSGGQPTLRVIGDISCDPNGSIEFSQPTYPDEPVYVYDPAKDDLSYPWNAAQFARTCHAGMDDSGVLVMAVTNLPAEFPRDAANAFGDMLKQFVPDLLKADFKQPLQEMTMSRQLKRAVIAHQGELAPDFVPLEGKVASRVLLLGAGLMSPGVIDYLLGQGIHVTVADASLEQAQSRIAGYPAEKAEAIYMPVDAEHRAALIEQLQQVDVAISMLPAPLHPVVAELCIETRTHLVTASYASPEMWALDEQAQAAGITLLNEVGLDPGLDHMSAMRIIDQIHAKGGRIIEFTSYCGGLPSPDAADNPLRFKASWSPAGIVSAANRPARFKQGGLLQVVEPETLFENPLIFRYDEIPFDLEAYPNGNSEFYIGAYGLQEARTFIRGTLRYAGWCEVILALHGLDWFSEQPASEIVERTIARSADLNGEIQAVVTWLGLTQKPDDASSARDYLLTCFIAQADLRYAPGERDLVVMRHTFDVEQADGQKKRLISSLVAEGAAEGLSAMASTVGLTAAICATLVLQGDYTRCGVQLPLTADLYAPVLDEMEKLGFGFVETDTPL